MLVEQYIPDIYEQVCRTLSEYVEYNSSVAGLLNCSNTSITHTREDTELIRQQYCCIHQPYEVVRIRVKKQLLCVDSSACAMTNQPNGFMKSPRNNTFTRKPVARRPPPPVPNETSATDSKPPPPVTKPPALTTPKLPRVTRPPPLLPPPNEPPPPLFVLRSMSDNTLLRTAHKPPPPKTDPPYKKGKKKTSSYTTSNSDKYDPIIVIMAKRKDLDLDNNDELDTSEDES